MQAAKQKKDCKKLIKYERFSRTETIPVLANSTDAPALSLRILTDHGLHGPIAFDGSVGRRLTLDAQLEDTCEFNFFSKLNWENQKAINSKFQPYLTCSYTIVLHTTGQEATML